MVTIIIMTKLFHLFISALCAAVFLDSVNLTETFLVSLSLYKLLLHINTFLSRDIWYCCPLRLHMRSTAFNSFKGDTGKWSGSLFGKFSSHLNSVCRWHDSQNVHSDDSKKVRVVCSPHVCMGSLSVLWLPSMQHRLNGNCLHKLSV